MLVFLINIDEECSALRRHQKSEDFQARLHDMMTRFVCQGGIPSGDDSDEYDARAIRVVNEAFEGIAQDNMVKSGNHRHRGHARSELAGRYRRERLRSHRGWEAGSTPRGSEGMEE